VEELEEMWDLLDRLTTHQLDYLSNFVEGNVGLLKLDHRSGPAWLIAYLRNGNP
jgi:hypothetical protein